MGKQKQQESIENTEQPKIQFKLTDSVKTSGYFNQIEDKIFSVVPTSYTTGQGQNGVIIQVPLKLGSVGELQPYNGKEVYMPTGLDYFEDLSEKQIVYLAQAGVIDVESGEQKEAYLQAHKSLYSKK
jgi:hypothetical protein